MSGWYKLIDILRLNDDEVAAWRDGPPTACPNDGEPLRTGPNGELFCISDGWTWDGTVDGKRGTA